MNPLIVITVACVAVAVACTVWAERWGRRGGGESLGRWRAARVAIVALYGACVGVVAMLLAYFFGLGQWTALAIAVPLGVPALLIAIYLAENS